MTVSTTTETRTFDSPKMLAQNVAAWLCTVAEAGGPRFSVCLSGGSTPRQLYEQIAAPAIESRFPWPRVHWFWGDERFVPQNDPDSNYRMAWDALLSRVPTPAANIHPIPTEGLSADEAAAAYEATLKKFYGAEVLVPDRPLFDVTLLGIGENGHTASLFPGRPALEERRRWAVATIDADAQPRITLTYPVLDSSRDVTGDRSKKARCGVAGPGRRSFSTGGTNSSARASPLVHGPCGRTRRNLMSLQDGRTRTTSPPVVMVVMGVSGSGKSTIGALLARRLCWEFEDADWLHPAANVDKMHNGIPLTDEDRRPWLAEVAVWIDKTRSSGGRAVVACSALKRRYRDVLIGDRSDVRLVYLKGDETLIARRIATRHEHFMPPSLLHSQFEALEEPGPDEAPIIASIAPEPREIVTRILSALGIDAALPEQAAPLPSGASA